MLILASASPRRREILTTLGIAHRVEVADIDESTQPGESPTAYVARVAVAKALAVGGRALAHEFVLAADTTVVLGDTILGKPESDAEAKRMLQGLMGRSHDVLTAVAVLVGKGAAEGAHVQVVRTRVTFVSASESAIDLYVACGEGRDKAGSYAVQGRGMGFVSSLTGSYSNVVGLPAAETIALLLAAGALSSWPLEVVS